jgi:hypothetical protein
VHAHCSLVHDLRCKFTVLTANFILDGSPEWAKFIENPNRAIAKGHPMFAMRLMPWCDGVFGNRSKQYNAHTNIYVTNASLPHNKLSQKYFVRFSSTSPHASALEQFAAFT